MVNDSPPSVDDLAERIRRREQSPAVRLRAAIELGGELHDAADALIERFVAEARAAGLSWTEIGQSFGTSKQAAQKRFGTTATEERGDWPGRWAPAARRALDRASEEARELGHNYVGTEHALLGLLAADDGLAAHVLDDLGVTYQRIMAQGCVRPVDEPRPYEALGVMPRLKQAIEHSMRIAETLGHRVTNTEHLLAGLVAVPDALAVEILKGLAVNANDVREALARRLDIDAQRLGGGAGCSPRAPEPRRGIQQRLRTGVPREDHARPERPLQPQPALALSPNVRGGRDRCGRPLTRYPGTGFTVEGMRTGQVAEQAGVNVQTLRYYERRGLLPEPARRESGYRVYGLDAVRTVRFIKRAQELGFDLSDAESLLALAAGGPESCDAARELADEKIAELDRRIADLIAMRESLGRLAATCAKPRTERECPLLHSIQEAAHVR